MRKALFIGLGFILSTVTASISWADGKRQLEQLSSQVPTLWQNYRPICVMGLEAEKQLRVDARLQMLDIRMSSEELQSALNSVGAPVLTAVWQKNAWQRMGLLELQALQPEEREEFREYYFKLQTNKPNQTRQDLITELQQTAQQLNMALREGIWKTCYALGMEGLAQEQLEAALENRWQKQRDNVDRQLEKELGSFFFYSYRQIGNEELKQFAQLQLDVLPWTESMAGGIKQHFTNLRQQLMTEPLTVIPTTDPADAPFPANRPWTPAPSQSPFQP